jgi:hypothetical protein
MTDISSQSEKRRERLIAAGQFTTFLAGVAAIVLVVVCFLSFVTDECEAGHPFLPGVFVCFPPR